MGDIESCKIQREYGRRVQVEHFLIRHAERTPFTDYQSFFTAKLTEQGREHARKFGKDLRKELYDYLVLRPHTSHVPRAIETGIGIMHGIGATITHNPVRTKESFFISITKESKFWRSSIKSVNTDGCTVDFDSWFFDTPDGKLLLNSLTLPLLREINSVRRMASLLPNGNKRVAISIAHDLNIGALLYILQHEEDRIETDRNITIGYMDGLRIKIIRNDEGLEMLYFYHQKGNTEKEINVIMKNLARTDRA